MVKILQCIVYNALYTVMYTVMNIVMYTVLRTILNNVLCPVHFPILYSTLYCTQRSKWLVESASALRKITFLLHVHSTERSTVHCNVQCLQE